MKTTIEILEFFKINNCEVSFEAGKYFIFNIWSNVTKRYILQNANETQLRNFYERVSK
jgi:hypothetical protein